MQKRTQIQGCALKLAPPTAWKNGGEVNLWDIATGEMT